jgi:hypothetical protein
MQVQNSKQDNMHHVTSDVPKGHKLLTNVQIFVIIINFGIFRVDCKKILKFVYAPTPQKSGTRSRGNKFFIVFHWFTFRRFT